MLATGFLLFALLWLTPSSPVKADDSGSIVGTWINAVVVNTPSGPQPFATELISISPRGTFVSTISIAHSSQNPAFSGPFNPFAPLRADFSDAFGTYQELGSNQFAVTFKRFIFAAANTSTVYGSFFPGQNVGVATVQAVATLQQDTLTGPFTFQLTNLQGTVVLGASERFWPRVSRSSP